MPGSEDIKNSADVLEGLMDERTHAYVFRCLYGLLFGTKIMLCQKRK